MGKKVLELGCATGYMSRVLRDRGCKVVAVEMDATAAARASQFCDRVIVADLDRVDLSRELGEELFDVIVAADVLEHLKDPLRVLRRIRPHLEPGGRVVASIPNVAHGSVRLALLTGTFPYSEVGLLDRTHLRFFTAASVERLFADAGFHISHVHRQRRALDRSEVPFDRAALPSGVVEAIAADPEALTYQFIVTAEPTADFDQDAAPADDLIEQEEESPEVAALRRAVDELRAGKNSLERRVAGAAKRMEALKSQRESSARESKALTEEMAARESKTRQRTHDLVEEVTLARSEIERLGLTLREREQQLERRLKVLWELGEEQERLRGRILDLEHERDAANDDRTEALRDLAAAQTEREAVVRLVDGMRRNQELMDKQQRERADLRRKVAMLTAREQGLREMLLEAHTQMIHRDEEFQVILTEVLKRGGTSGEPSTGGPGRETTIPSGHLQYQLLVKRIREAADGCVPPDATVIVVSKGDPELLELGSRRAWHFPQANEGEYAGFYPANSSEAIDHLENLRARGGEFFLLPATSLWWLKHYGEFRDHLESRYRTVASIDDVCMIVDVRRQADPSDTTDEVAARVAGNGHGDARRRFGARHPLRSLRRSRSPG
jgi:SAM-dependent methyltransferase